MTRFIVRCIYNGTKKDLAVSAMNARVALDKAKKKESNASCYIAYLRSLNNMGKNIPILTTTN